MDCLDWLDGGEEDATDLWEEMEMDSGLAKAKAGELVLHRAKFVIPIPITIPFIQTHDQSI
jgi:hypothetical protein